VLSEYYTYLAGAAGRYPGKWHNRERRKHWYANCLIVFNLEPKPRGWLELNGRKAVALVVTSWLAAACGGDPASSSGGAHDGAAELTAATLGAQSLLPAREYLQQPPYAGADRENGQRLAQMCKACHTLGEGGVHMIGPNLFGFFGRPAGSAERYTYSAALQEAEFSWTPRALDAWLTRPARFLPGNRMSFPGVSSASDRADMIAYLLDVTSPQGGD
jgi:cytochrome c